jgi:hypothetical protein
MTAFVDELLLSAEYILVNGNSHVIPCERCIRGFDATRATSSTSPPCRSYQLSHLPMIGDPSHAMGARAKVVPLTSQQWLPAPLASWSSFTRIDRALSDGAKSLRPEQFEDLVGQVRLLSAGTSHSPCWWGSILTARIRPARSACARTPGRVPWLCVPVPVRNFLHPQPAMPGARPWLCGIRVRARQVQQRIA